MLRRYWAAYPQERRNVPRETADRILVFQRGAEVVSAGVVGGAAAGWLQGRQRVCSAWSGGGSESRQRADNTPIQPPRITLELSLSLQATMGGSYFMLKVNLLISFWILQPLFRLCMAVLKLVRSPVLSSSSRAVHAALGVLWACCTLQLQLQLPLWHTFQLFPAVIPPHSSRSRSRGLAPRAWPPPRA